MEDQLQLTEEEQQKLQEWADEFLAYHKFHKFAPEYLKIKTKIGDIVPFKLNPHQKKFLLVYYKQLLAGRPIRIIVLKDRQKGISTLAEGIMFQRNSFRHNRKGAVVSYKKSSTDAIFQMFLRYKNNFPQDLIPDLISRNAKGLFYEIDSEIKLYTAEAGDIGSSETIQDVHFTELSKYRDAETTLIAMLQTVPEEPNTMVIIESTAAGSGNEYHKRWKMAENGESNYEAVFLSWLDDDEYTKPFASIEMRDEFMGTLDKEEELLHKLGATPEHMHWRRKIGLPDKCGGSLQKFRQEYPATADQAFIASGNPVFDTNQCELNKAFAREVKPERGEFEFVRDIEGNVYDVKWVPNVNGRWRKYREFNRNPEEYNRYAAGADVAEGLGEEDDHDYSSCAMLDRENMDVPIEFWDRDTDEDAFAEEIYKLYMYVNGNVWINVLKRAGHVVITRLFDQQVKMYYRQNFSKGWREDKAEIGFDENRESKKRGIGLLTEYIRDSLFHDYSVIFWGETVTYVNKEGKMGAQPGCHDDTVACRMAMLVCHRWLPVPSKKQEYPEDKPQTTGRKVASVMSYKGSETTF